MTKFNFKKKYGQNFLRDNIILDKISNSFSAEDDSIIIEIGPGDGALTKKLIKKGVNVVSFEIDETLKPYLNKIESNNLKVIYDDFLKVNLSNYFNKNDKLNVIANIPYYITTPIITKFIEEDFIPDNMVLMVQKEVALRLSSKPKNKEYGAISVILNYFFDIEYLFTVNRGAFEPIPNVDSAVIKFSRKKDRLFLKSFEKYKRLVFDSFKQKRKTLKNNLKNYDLELIDFVLKKYNLSINNRAEELMYEIFVEISNNL